MTISCLLFFIMITFKNVWKTYPKSIGSPSHTALSDLSFFLDKGETLGLVGANGAGKTTTIHLILDFLRPDEGEVKLFDRPVDIAENRAKIGYLPEVPNYPDNLSVNEMVDFTGQSCGIDKNVLGAAKEKWLNFFDLWDARNRSVKHYSKGMKQRASFATALINDPDLLILDEPMSGLDPVGREKIFQLLMDLKQEGKTILFCSHILEDVDRLVDKVLVLDKGENLFMGRPDTFCNQFATTSFVQAFLNCIGPKV